MRQALSAQVLRAGALSDQTRPAMGSLMTGALGLQASLERRGAHAVASLLPEPAALAEHRALIESVLGEQQSRLLERTARHVGLNAPVEQLAQLRAALSAFDGVEF